MPTRFNCYKHLVSMRHTIDKPPSRAVWDVVKDLDGLPGGDRTPDPQLRRLMLYPTELRAEIESKALG